MWCGGKIHSLKWQVGTHQTFGQEYDVCSSVPDDDSNVDTCVKVFGLSEKQGKGF